MNSKLQVLGKGFVEFRKVVLVLGDLLEHLNNLFDNVLANDFENLVLLEHFTGDVQGKILRVDDSLDKGEPLGDELLTVVHDKDPTNVEFDIVLFFRLKHVHWGSTRDKENGAEFQLSFDLKVFYREMVFPVIREGLVKGGVLLSGNVFGVARLGLPWK